MKYAYISTQEPFSLGVRIVQVDVDTKALVDVDDLLFWVECADDVTPVTHYYDISDNKIKLVPKVIK